MRNGGGPACLRLRIVLTPQQEHAIHPGVVYSPDKHAQLGTWIEKNYRDRLIFDDLRDPEFFKELDAAYGALEPLLGMVGLYDGYRIDQSVR
jgi:succinylarginine dihydrolase